MAIRACIRSEVRNFTKTQKSDLYPKLNRFKVPKGHTVPVIIIHISIILMQIWSWAETMFGRGGEFGGILK